MGQGKSKPTTGHERNRSRSGSGSFASGLDATEGSKSRSLQQALVREREGKRRQEFEDIYDVKHEIGQGGLCKIYKIEKKGEKIGGSSRPENVRKSGIDLIFSTFPNAVVQTSNHSSNHTTPRQKSRKNHLSNGGGGDFVSIGSLQPMYFALKVFNLVLLKEDKIESLRNEVEILKSLDHPNIIKAYEAFTTRKSRKVRRFFLTVVDDDDLVCNRRL